MSQAASSPKFGQRFDPRFISASLDPLTIRYLAAIIGERGYDPDIIFRGLGFDAKDLANPAFKISYRQASLAIVRVQKALKEDALGLLSGSRQHLTSLGPLGLCMMACATFGEAVQLGLRYQNSAGVLVQIDGDMTSEGLEIIAKPTFHESGIEPFLIEELFAALINVAKGLIGLDYVPKRVELAYSPPPYAAKYESVLRCPVDFNCARNRLISEQQWLEHRLAMHDPYVRDTMISQLDGLHLEACTKTDLLNTIERSLLKDLQNVPSLHSIARDMNMSERTLRRRLDELAFSFQDIHDSVRKMKSFELLQDARYSLQDVATETGFAETRSFRRAFKRWTGISPSEFSANLAQADTATIAR